MKPASGLYSTLRLILVVLDAVCGEDVLRHLVNVFTGLLSGGGECVVDCGLFVLSLLLGHLFEFTRIEGAFVPEVLYRKSKRFVRCEAPRNRHESVVIVHDKVSLGEIAPTKTKFGIEFCQLLLPIEFARTTWCARYLVEVRADTQAAVRSLTELHIGGDHFCKSSMAAMAASFA